MVWDETVFSIFDGEFDSAMLLTAAITIVPISLATVVEHIGDMSAISATVGQNFIQEPGLHRTLVGDGIARASGLEKCMAGELQSKEMTTRFGALLPLQRTL